MVLVNRFKKTVAAPMQFAHDPFCLLPPHKHFKSHFPPCNYHHQNKYVANDTLFCVTPPAHDDGSFHQICATMAQLYAGKNSAKTVVYPMWLGSDMQGTLEDLLIGQHVTPTSLFSDDTKVQCGTCVLNLHLCGIKVFKKELHRRQQQNFAERKMGDA
jgi:hypothetical protein